MATRGNAVSKRTVSRVVVDPTARALAPSPLGTIVLEATDSGLRSLKLQSDEAKPTALSGPPPRGDAAKHLAAARRQLAEYFSGRRRRFDLPLDPKGNAFELSVWEHVSRIPYGTTISFDEVAERLGSPDKSTQVASTNRQNPLPIVIPCHRVVASDGSLGPYAGGKPEIKWRLLQLEGVAPIEN